MLTLTELGAVQSGGSQRIPCETAEAAVRLLRAAAEGGNNLLPQHRARVLLAVADWIKRDQQDQADVREGMSRLMLDAAAQVGKKMR